MNVPINIVNFIEQSLSYHKKPDLTSDEREVVRRWGAMQPEAAYQRLLKDLRGETPPQGQYNRKPRVRAFSFTDMERRILIKAVGHLLLSGQVEASHARLLLQKLERA